MDGGWIFDSVPIFMCKGGKIVDSKTAFARLGLQEDAGKEDVKRAYRSLSKVLHPDRNPSKKALEKYLYIKEAYEYLMNLDWELQEKLKNKKKNCVGMEHSKRTTGKIIGGWPVSSPDYTEQQYRQMQLKKMKETKKKQEEEQQEQKRKIIEAKNKARKLPSQKEEEKWKKIEMEREARRIAEIIKRLIEMNENE